MSECIEVFSCAGCPFHDAGLGHCSVGGEHRSLRSLGFNPFVDNRPPPDWCPLRKADHLVTLRTR